MGNQIFILGNNLKNEVSERIVESMDKLGLKIDLVSKRTLIGTTTLNRYRSGIYPPKDSFIELYSKAFNINKDWLLTGNGLMQVREDKKEEIDGTWLKLSSDVYKSFNEMYEEYKKKEDIEIDMSAYFGRILKRYKKFEAESKSDVK